MTDTVPEGLRRRAPAPPERAAAAPRRREWGRFAPRLHVAVDQGDGPIVVLVHGINSSSQSWVHLVPLLTPLYRVIAIDLLGFGSSVAPPNTTFTLEEHVAALHATIRSLRLKQKFTIVGHSLGSLVSSRYAAQYAKEVSQVVLVAPPIYDRSMYISDASDRLAVKSYLRFYRALRTDQQRTTRRLEFIARFLPIHGVIVEERYWNAFALSLENCIESQTTITDVAHIGVTVDVVYGSRDPVVVNESIERIGRLTHVSVHRVVKADHIVRSAMAREIARVID